MIRAPCWPFGRWVGLLYPCAPCWPFGRWVGLLYPCAPCWPSVGRLLGWVQQGWPFGVFLCPVLAVWPLGWSVVPLCPCLAVCGAQIAPVGRWGLRLAVGRLLGWVQQGWTLAVCWDGCKPVGRLLGRFEVGRVGRVPVPVGLISNLYIIVGWRGHDPQCWPNIQKPVGGLPVCLCWPSEVGGMGANLLAVCIGGLFGL